MDRKSLISEFLPELFNELQINLEGKTVLDVGASKGYHAQCMQNMGATVFANDVKDQIENPNTITNRLITKIQDISPEYYRKFDVVTAFRIFPNFNIDDDTTSTLNFCRALSNLAKPDGVIIMGYGETYEYTSKMQLFSSQAFSKIEKVQLPGRNYISDENNLIFSAKPNEQLLKIQPITKKGTPKIKLEPAEVPSTKISNLYQCAQHLLSKVGIKI